MRVELDARLQQSHPGAHRVRAPAVGEQQRALGQCLLLHGGRDRPWRGVARSRVRQHSEILAGVLAGFWPSAIVTRHLQHEALMPRIR
jgi:hypothetical protein